MLKVSFIFAYLILLSGSLYAQQDSLLNRWLEFSTDNTTLAEHLQTLAEHPLDLNQADRAELLQLPFLSEQEADNLLRERRRLGSFKRKTELRKILGKEKYKLLRPFFTISHSGHSSFNLSQKNVLAIDADASDYSQAGQRVSNYTKFYYEVSNHLKTGLISQKDAGESDWLDYLSGFVSYHLKDWQLIAGQYEVRFAHGLLFSNPFANEKSAMVLNPLRKTADKISPSLSTAENSGLFGLALSGSVAAGHLFLFISQQRLDARFNSRRNAVIGIDYDGYHITDRAQAAKDILTEQTAGIALSYSVTSALKASAMATYFHYTPAIRFNTETVGDNALRRQYFHFSGNHLFALSGQYAFHLGNWNLSGEAVANPAAAPGYSQKIFIQLPSLQYGLLYWRIGKNFQSPHGRVFDDSNPFPAAQQGFYFAGKMNFDKGFVLRGYKLLSQDLWRTYFSSMPETKDEWLLQGDFGTGHKKFTFRLRQKTNPFSNLVSRTQTIYRLHYAWRPSALLRLQTRFVFTHLHPLPEDGMYLFQDLRYRLLHPLTLYTRFTFFDTHSFASALYEYENNVPGSFSNYVLYGEGYKWYVMLRLRWGGSVDFWFKFRYLRRRSHRAAAYCLQRGIRFLISLKR